MSDVREVRAPADGNCCRTYEVESDVWLRRNGSPLAELQSSHLLHCHRWAPPDGGRAWEMTIMHCDGIVRLEHLFAMRPCTDRTRHLRKLSRRLHTPASPSASRFPKGIHTRARGNAPGRRNPPHAIPTPERLHKRKRRNEKYWDDRARTPFMRGGGSG